LSKITIQTLSAGAVYRAHFGTTKCVYSYIDFFFVFFVNFLKIMLDGLPGIINTKTCHLVANSNFLGDNVDYQLPTGTFESTLDEKGRVVVPVSLRESFTGKLVITQGLEACVWIMTSHVYENYFLKQLDNLQDTLSYKEIEALRYHHEAPARSVEIDEKTGRVPVPVALRSYAKLSKNCLVLSIDGHLEIWDNEEYYKFSGQTKDTAKEAMNKIEGKVSFFPKRGQA